MDQNYEIKQIIFDILCFLFCLLVSMRSRARSIHKQMQSIAIVYIRMNDSNE